MTDKEKIYFRVAEGLAGCQRVELELKNYMSGAMELARKCIGGVMPFHSSGSDFQNYSLEKLIEHFKNYSDDRDLVSSLRTFKNERNYLAHQALLSLVSPDGEFDHGEMIELHRRVSGIEAEADRLSRLIYTAAGKLWVQVWFEKIEEPK